MSDLSKVYMNYPEQLEINPLSVKPDRTIRVPGSKSITNRALVLAALCARDGGCTLTGALQSEDTEVMVDCLNRLGFRVETKWDEATIIVHRNPSSRLIPADKADLYVANSGTTMRFLTAMVSLGYGEYRLDGVPRMRERPIQDLLTALEQLGVQARSEAETGCPPVLIESAGWNGMRVAIQAGLSSQFLSGLMMAAPFVPTTTEIETIGERVSEPYIEMTVRMAGQWGLIMLETDFGWEVEGVGRWRGPAEYAIEPDASAASYFWAMAAITGGRIRVSGLSADSLQGDVAFVDVLQQMGCRVERDTAGITVQGDTLQGIDVDMNAISDTVMTLGAVTCFAKGPTTIRNVGHIRHKETDRIAALATELRKVGASVEEFQDGLRIIPGVLQGAVIDTYQDHRMAMSLALVGLKIPGVVIKDPGCVAKTYPGFWRDLDPQ